MIDELDTQIIGELQKNGTATNAGISRKVGVSEETVRRRINRLVVEGMIRIVAIPDPLKMGFETQAIIGIQVNPGEVDAIADILIDIPQVNKVSVVTGTYDIFIWVALRSAPELREVLRKEIGIIPGIQRTETFTILEIKKRDFGVNLNGK